MSNYDTRIRQAISDEYVRCSNEINIIRKDIHLIEDKLKKKDCYSYADYIILEKNYENLKRELSELCIEIETWDKAREICFKIADEMKR
jgi:hypothetical protein